MDESARDLRHAIRSLLREPGFTLLVVLALALGTGATTAIFTVVDSVLLRPLPYKDPDRLVVALHGESANGPVSPADYFDYRRAARSFERLGAAQAWGATLGGGERPERVSGLQMSAELFELLGVPPLQGRTFAAGDDQPGRERVVVLTHGFWERRFAADPGLVGRSIPLDGQPYTVIGIMPRNFRFAPFWQTRAEMFVPLALAHRLNDRGGRSLRVFGRLKDGVTLEQAQAEMSSLASNLERAYPQTNTGLVMTVRPLLDKVVSDVSGTLMALMAMVGFVMLIACANVTNALLARSAERQRDVAIRVAMGASRARVIRHLLAESLLLSAAGAMLGVVVAAWGIEWLLGLLPPGSLPRQQEVSLDARVFGVAAVAAIVTGLLTGLIPALQLARTGLPAVFHDESRSATEGAGRRRFRSVLVASEMTLALVLLVGAGLMARTMLNLGAIDPGFAVDRIAVVGVSLAGTGHAAPDARASMFKRVREHLGMLPGAASVSAINHLPLAGDIWFLGYTIVGRPAPPAGHGWSAAYRIVLPGYFRTMGVQLIEGRDFTENDGPSSPHVAIINKAMADRQWPGESPVGRFLRLPGPGDVQEPIAVVGVVANAAQSSWTDAPGDEVYLALAQRAPEFGLSSMTFVLQTSVEPAAIAAALARHVAELDRSIPVTELTTMRRVVADELWRERLTARLTSMFAAIALGLAAIGVYAVVAYAVTRRAREFGVRVALGATPASVRRLALRDALRPVVAGAAAGLGLSAVLSKLLATVLFDVAALDPVALAAAVAVLLLAAVCAAWVPAYRASQLDPVVVLRKD